MNRLANIVFVLTLFFLLSMPASLLAEDTVCIECHSGQEGRLAEPVSAWRTSIHAENGVSCHDCHGGDSTDFAMAMSPENGFLGAPDYEEVPDFCGQCHVGVAKEYKAGAHGKALEQGGAQCVVCHGNHAVKKASLDLINEQTCTQCHSYERAALIKLSLSETDAMVNKVEKSLERLFRLGVAVDKMKGDLFQQRNRFHSIFHEVDVALVRQETSSVQGELGKINSEIEAIDVTLEKRKMWGGLSAALLLFGGIVSMLIRRTYHDEEGH